MALNTPSVKDAEWKRIIVDLRRIADATPLKDGCIYFDTADEEKRFHSRLHLLSFSRDYTVFLTNEDADRLTELILHRMKPNIKDPGMTCQDVINILRDQLGITIEQ